MCPHNLTKTQLEHHLNQHRNLALMGKILHETFGATKALARLPTTPITLPKINPPMQTFSVIPQSPTHYKVNIDGTEIKMGVAALWEGQAFPSV